MPSTIYKIMYRFNHKIEELKQTLALPGVRFLLELDLVFGLSSDLRSSLVDFPDDFGEAITSYTIHNNKSKLLIGF